MGEWGSKIYWVIVLIIGIATVYTGIGIATDTGISQKVNYFLLGLAGAICMAESVYNLFGKVTPPKFENKNETKTKQR